MSIASGSSSSALAALTRASGLALALLAMGCGSAAFRVVLHAPPVIRVEGARTIWIATDLTDPVSHRIAERLESALADLAPTEIVAVGRPPEAGVVVLSLAIRRSVSHRPALVQQPVWTCDPSGLCYARDMPRVLDVPVVRVLVRLGAHEASGRLLLPPRILDESRAGDDEMSAETSLVSVVSARIAQLFRATHDELALPVEEPGDVGAAAALARALEEPDEARCARLAELVPPPRDRRAHASLLFDAGQCERAVAVRAEAPAQRLAALRRAEVLLLTAVRALPSERYAAALAETRAWLRVLAPRGDGTPEPTPPEPTMQHGGPESLPEPPPSYR